MTPIQDIPNGDHTVTITAAKDGATSDPLTLTLGINTGLAETGMPVWPLPLFGAMALVVLRLLLRRQVA